MKELAANRPVSSRNAAQIRNADIARPETTTPSGNGLKLRNRERAKPLFIKKTSLS
jgi:hypothetical protein